MCVKNKRRYFEECFVTIVYQKQLCHCGAKVFGA